MQNKDSRASVGTTAVQIYYSTRPCLCPQVPLHLRWNPRPHQSRRRCGSESELGSSGHPTSQAWLSPDWASLASRAMAAEEKRAQQSGASALPAESPGSCLFSSGQREARMAFSLWSTLRLPNALRSKTQLCMLTRHEPKA